MQFKSFIFPNNPTRLEVGLKSRLGVGHCPGYGPILQELGVQQRIITGEGAFFGSGAQEDYQQLEALLFEQTPGLLVLPGMAPMTAHFSKLTWLGEGDGRVIRYSFEFVEEPGPAWGREEKADGTA